MISKWRVAQLAQTPGGEGGAQTAMSHWPLLILVQKMWQELFSVQFQYLNTYSFKSVKFLSVSVYQLPPAEL